jgi:hypothetical protein
MLEKTRGPQPGREARKATRPTAGLDERRGVKIAILPFATLAVPPLRWFLFFHSRPSETSTIRGLETSRQTGSMKSTNKRSNPLKRVARKALRHISGLKLARAQGEDKFPSLADLERAEDALVKATSDVQLRSAIMSAAELIGQADASTAQGATVH